MVFFALLLGVVELTAQTRTYNIASTIGGAGRKPFNGSGNVATLVPLDFSVSGVVDRDDNFYFSENGAHRVWKLTLGGRLLLMAGTGDSGSTPGGSRAIQSKINRPYGVAISPDGLLHFADSGNNRICRIDAEGKLIVLAGTGRAAFFGDGGPAIAADLNNPRSLTFDSQGNLFVADAGNLRIRRIGTDGRIQTVAGTGQTLEGSGLSVNTANLRALATDADDSVFFSDSTCLCVRRLSPQGAVTLIAGNGAADASGDGSNARNAGLGNPRAIAFDSKRRLFIAADVSGDGRIRRVDTDGTISSIAGPRTPGAYAWSAAGSSLNYNFAGSNGLAVDSHDNIYLTHSGVRAIYRITPSGLFTTVAGGFPSFTTSDAISTNFRGPNAVGSARNGIPEVYVADGADARVYRISASGQASVVVGNGIPGSPTEGPALSTRLDGVTGLAADGNGGLFLGGPAFVGFLSTEGTLRILTRAVDAQQIDVYPGGVVAAEPTRNRVVRVGFDGSVTILAGTGQAGFSGDGGPATAAQLNAPRSVSVDPRNGDLYIADTRNNRIRRLTSDGIISTMAGDGRPANDGDNGPATSAGINAPLSVSADSLGNLYIGTQSRIRRLTAAGTILDFAGSRTNILNLGEGLPNLLTDFYFLEAIATGPNALFIVDSEAGRVRKFTPVALEASR